MNLVIRAVMLDDLPLEEPLLGIFDARGGTIGRSQANTLALPDPERRLSRLQAEISSGAGGYVIRNAGTTSSILVNALALAPGESGRIAHRDELRLGGYVLRVLLEEEGLKAGGAHVAVDARAVLAAAAHEQRTDPRFITQRAGSSMATIAPMADAAVARQPQSSSSNPFADLLASPGTPMRAGAAASDPFADLLAPSAASQGGQRGGVSSRPAAMAPASPTHADDPFAFIESLPAPAAVALPAAAARAALPDDFDPFADLDGATSPVVPEGFSAVPAIGPGSSQAAPAPADLLGAVGASSGRSAGLDEAFGLSARPSGGADPLAAFMAGTATGDRADRGPGSLDSAASTDPLAMFTSPGIGTPRSATARPAAAANHTAELQAAYVPPRIIEPTAPLAGASSPPVAARESGVAARPRPGSAASARPIAADAGNQQTLPPSLVGRPAPPRPLAAQISAASPERPDEPMAPAVASPAAVPSKAGMAPPRSAVTGGEATAVAPPPGGMLWAAFCEGAGISLPLPQGMSPDQMRLLGRLLREAVDGTRRQLAERDSARRAAQAAPLPAPARGHNPLALAANTEVALEQLLQPPLRGFIGGPAALQAAMRDVAQHIAASSAGARSGLAAAVACFEPAQLEPALTKGMLGLPRKARMWEQYQQQFEEVRSDARERYRAQLANALAAAPPEPR